MKRSLFMVLVCCIASAQPARADVVSDWMEAAEAIRVETRGTTQARSFARFVPAQVALAMFEAVNAIDRRYESYLRFPQAPTTASQEAAASVAAHAVLKAAYPGRAASLDASLAFVLGVVPDGPEKAAGVQVGEAAAAAVMKRPLLDAGVTVPDYRPPVAPGVYILADLPTIPMSVYAFNPWFLRTRDEVRPPPPPRLDSERYGRDVEEVRKLGGRVSRERTSAQTAAASFWSANRPVLAIRLLSDTADRPLVTNARVHALLQMAGADAFIAVGIAKYEAAFWRPVTAIRNADRDDNPETRIDPAWEPLLPTPPFAEYPCAHCIGAAVQAGIVETEFGPDAQMTFVDPDLPGAGRTLTPREFVREMSMSRIYAGAHFRFSNEAAEEMGRRIARLAVERHLRPIGAGSSP